MQNLPDISLYFFCLHLSKNQFDPWYLEGSAGFWTKPLHIYTETVHLVWKMNRTDSLLEIMNTHCMCMMVCLKSKKDFPLINQLKVVQPVWCQSVILPIAMDRVEEL